MAVLEVLLFEGVQVVQRKGLGGGDVYRPGQEIAQGGGGRPHHLVHDLADGADGEVVELELLVWNGSAHEDVHNDLDVVALEEHDVAPLQAGDVLDLDANGGLQVPQGKLVHRNHRHGRCGDVHPVIQHV